MWFTKTWKQKHFSSGRRADKASLVASLCQTIWNRNCLWICGAMECKHNDEKLIHMTPITQVQLQDPSFPQVCCQSREGKGSSEHTRNAVTYGVQALHINVNAIKKNYRKRHWLGALCCQSFYIIDLCPISAFANWKWPRKGLKIVTGIYMKEASVWYLNVVGLETHSNAQ
jgi:hypothetical protein